MTQQVSAKEQISNFVRNGVGDFTAAGAVAAYYGLQLVVPSMPDLPMWAVIVLMALATLRGVAMRYLDDRRLTPSEIADALVEAAEDGRAAVALVEDRTGVSGEQEARGAEGGPPPAG